jgi:hypothetical protein
MSALLALGWAALAAAHGNHGQSQKVVAGPHKSLWYNTLPGDGGTQADSVFSGISTFGRLPYQNCLQNPDAIYDIAFIGENLLLPRMLITANKPQVPRLTRARRTARVLASAPRVSGRALVG